VTGADAARDAQSPVTETVTEAVTEPVAEHAAQQAGESAPGARTGRGRRIAAITGAALLTVAVLGVSGFTVVTVRDADRDPGKPVWAHAAAPEAKEPPAAEADGLRGMLLPWGENWLGQGPDMGEFGSDAELTGKEATELAKESFKELPRTQRKQLEKAVEKRHIKGVAMRSYATLTFDERAYAIETVLTQVEGEKNAQDDVKGERKIYEALKKLGVLTAGPKVPGHEKNAWCYLLDAEKDAREDMMFCLAHKGEVEVGFTVDSARPMNKKDVAGVLGKQLDRIENPGEAV
jgi:hypothetical protein